MYSTFETKDYLFSSPKSRMSQEDLEKAYNDLQEFSKNGESTKEKTAVLQKSSQEVDLDQLIRNKKFFKINKVWDKLPYLSILFLWIDTVSL